MRRCGYHCGFAHAEPLHQICLYAWSGGGGKREDLRIAERRPFQPHAKVGGTKVVSPLRDAVCFVDAQERRASGFEDLAHIGRLEGFGSGEHDELPPLLESCECRLSRPLAQRAVQAHDRNAAREQGPFLVLHQGNEGEQGHYRTVGEHRQHLINERLAVTGGQYHEGVAFRECRVKRLHLLGVQVADTEALPRYPTAVSQRGATECCIGVENLRAPPRRALLAGSARARPRRGRWGGR